MKNKQKLKKTKILRDDENVRFLNVLLCSIKFIKNSMYTPNFPSIRKEKTLFLLSFHSRFS